MRDFIAAKRASMAAHASQIAETSFFLHDARRGVRGGFGWEWFIRHGVARRRPMDDDLFAGLG